MPLALLVKSPITLALSIFGLVFLPFTTITQTYGSTYGWSPEFTGLVNLGIGADFFIGNIVVAKMSDATIIWLTKKNNGV
jgi:predicted MFS family arabinose efflux permease